MVAVYTLVGKHLLKFHETRGLLTAGFPALPIAPSMLFVLSKYLLTTDFYEKRSKNFSLVEKPIECLCVKLGGLNIFRSLRQQEDGGK